MKIGKSMKKPPEVSPEIQMEAGANPQEVALATQKALQDGVQPSAGVIMAKQETSAGVQDAPSGPTPDIMPSGFQPAPAESVTLGTQPEPAPVAHQGTVYQNPEPNIDLPPQTVINAPNAAIAPGTKKGGLLLRGVVAQNAVSTEQTKANLAISQNQFRFYCDVGGEARVTFVDGELDQDGALAIPYWYEHRLMIGRMLEVVCFETNPTLGPCPICLAGHKTQLVGGLTVINHTPHTIKNGANAGKILTNRRQMFVAPRTALETLQKLATKRGGLAGHCFDIYRKEKKDPRVGSIFDYVGALNQDQINGIGKDWTPFNWDEEIKLTETAEMTKFGNLAVPYGGTQQQGGGGAAALKELEI